MYALAIIMLFIWALAIQSVSYDIIAFMIKLYDMKRGDSDDKE